MEVEQAERILVGIVSKLGRENSDFLMRLKGEYSQIQREDFLWHYLLQSFATMGRAAGAIGLIQNQDNYARVTYDALLALPNDQRLPIVIDTCRNANVRMPNRKASYIVGCLNLIESMGGPAEAKRQLFACCCRDAKISFLIKFPGIGQKYARNMMMDVYHEDFRDSIAIDIRIKAISTALGIEFENYHDHEAFYINVARLAGLNGWELDRLMFNFKNEIVGTIENA